MARKEKAEGRKVKKRPAEKDAVKKRPEDSATETKRETALEMVQEAEDRAKAAEKEAAEAQEKLHELQREQTLEEAAAFREKVRKAKEQPKEHERTYVVESGDSLSKIAKEVYGDASRWPDIYEANRDKIDDPNLIYPGQELRIP
jgi:nucleoid-associated protein YgaU